MVTLRYAIEYARHGWPVLVTEPAGKLPLTRHGVKDATIDPHQIERWFARWPRANLAVATGAPGPQVLDIDDLDAAAGTLSQLSDVPCVATARGRHYWFAGVGERTITLGYGELRGRGSYVIAPPSIHETGTEYVWLLAPHGPLPAPPAIRGTYAGTGTHHPPPKPIVAGEGRWPYLRDFAVRLVRAGVTDRGRIAAHLRTEFEVSCEPDPPASPGALDALAEWAARSQIADRERAVDHFETRIRNWRETDGRQDPARPAA
jgi:hypothetical protein